MATKAARRRSVSPVCCASVHGSVAIATAIPFVTPETTALAIRLRAQDILREYLRRVEELNHHLTYSSSLVTPSPMFSAHLEADNRQMSALFADAPHQYAQEPYRRKLFLMYHRLRHNYEQVRARAEGHLEALPIPFWGYASERAFLDDLSPDS